MNLSASNIAWTGEEDESVYDHLHNLGFSGIEVAPTRMVEPPAYTPGNIARAAAQSVDLRVRRGLRICSVQSLWFGLTEAMFGSEEERTYLLNYTRRALDFAAAISAPHVVFGNPRNRRMQSKSDWQTGVYFFSACAEYAANRNVVIGLEANPASYGTNYLTTTREVFDLVGELNSAYLRANLDLGTILENSELLADIIPYVPLISHVHISEPHLVPVRERPEHRQLNELLRHAGYVGWISLEMRNSGPEALLSALRAMANAFCA